MRRAALAAAVVLGSLGVTGVRAQSVCEETPRSSTAPLFAVQQQAFGFHDEEIVICTPGDHDPTHIAARLWVPLSCPGVGGCPGVLMAHGYGFSKEITFSDMLNAVRRGLYVLSYDVRGQGSSGGQATFLTRQDVADQAAVLGWFHREVRPTKTAVFGISQGGWLALVAGIFNCGSARAAAYEVSIPCDRGERWVDAIAPVEGPSSWSFDQGGTCNAIFGLETFAESRAYPGFVPTLTRCAADGTPAESGVQELGGVITAPFGPIDLHSRLGRVDVPVYLATSFADRLVPPNIVTRAYEVLRAREKNPHDPYKRDVRLLISDEGHGEIGGNIAAMNDIFTWIDRMLRGKGPQRDARVSIAQEWAGGTFRLERDWPIPGTKVLPLYLSRTTSDPAARGTLTTRPPGAREPADQLMNVPTISSQPGAPGVDQAWQNSSGTPIPGLRLDYLSPPMTSTVEITDAPLLTLWVSSSNPASRGRSQLHGALYEVGADGSVTEFARGRVGVAGLGARAEKVTVPFTVSDDRIPRGSSLLLSIMPSDALQVVPATNGDSLFVHHGRGTPSALVVRLAPMDRVPPHGTPPRGPASTQDPVGAACASLGLPC